MMPHNKIMIPLFLLLLLFSTPSMALEEPVVLEESIDTWIWNVYEGSTGTHPVMFVMSTVSRSMWAFSLVKFVLPAGLNVENIDSAQLELYPYTASALAVKVNLHRVLKPWEENSKWPDFPLLGNYPDYPDSQDLFDEDVECSLFATDGSMMSFDVTDLVKDWISDPSSNYGVLLETPYSEVPSAEIRAVGICTSDAEEAPCVDYHPKLIIDYRETVPATIDFHPDTLNLKSKGQWMTCYIELPEGHDVEDIDISTMAITSISVNGEEAEVGDCDGNGILDGILAEDQPTEVGDYDEDGIPDLMVKFDRGCIQKGITDLMDEFDTHTESVQEATPVVGLAKVKINIYFDTDLTGFKGFDTDSTGFEGFDEVDIIDKGN